MWPRALYHARSAAALAPYESEVWLSVAHCVSGMRYVTTNALLYCMAYILLLA